MIVTLLFKDGHPEEREVPDDAKTWEKIFEGEDRVFNRLWTRNHKGRVSLFVEEGITQDVIDRWTLERFP